MLKFCKNNKPSSQSTDDSGSVNEIRIEINDSNTSHNNNFAISLKSKTTDVDKLLPMAREWIKDHKQKSWSGP